MELIYSDLNLKFGIYVFIGISDYMCMSIYIIF
jgi:hypothetical protein